MTNTETDEIKKTTTLAEVINEIHSAGKITTLEQVLALEQWSKHFEGNLSTNDIRYLIELGKRAFGLEE